VLAITAGLISAGIAGALLSVPLLAVLNAGVRSFLHDGDVDPDEVDVLDDDGSRPEPDEGAAPGTSEGGLASAVESNSKTEPEPDGPSS
jgi:hypothetical protein